MAMTLGPEKSMGELLEGIDRIVAIMPVPGASTWQRTLGCAHGLKLPPPKETCCPGSLGSNVGILKGGTF